MNERDESMAMQGILVSQSATSQSARPDPGDVAQWANLCRRPYSGTDWPRWRRHGRRSSSLVRGYDHIAAARNNMSAMNARTTISGSAYDPKRTSSELTQGTFARKIA